MAPIGDQPEEEQDAEIEEDVGDVEPLKKARDPKLPSAADIAEHELTHIPYRDWCKWCNLGRGRGIPHRQGGDSAVPIVGTDDFFITSEGVNRDARSLSSRRTVPVRPPCSQQGPVAR